LGAKALRYLVLGAALAALSFASAGAEEARPAKAVQAEPAKKLYICDQDEMTRRAFVREHGRIEFVKAEDAAQAKAAWATPKCITTVEHQRLKRMQFAQAR
jgi:hypothetical protein